MKIKFLKYFLASFFRFIEDFSNIFRTFPDPLRKKLGGDLKEYLIMVEKDLNSAFQEIIREYERE